MSLLHIHICQGHITLPTMRQDTRKICHAHHVYQTALQSAENCGGD